MPTLHTPPFHYRRRLPRLPARRADAVRGYGLTQDEILRAIRAGRLQFRESSMHGSPWLRLLRHEVEALVGMDRGAAFLESRQARTELAHIDREL